MSVERFSRVNCVRLSSETEESSLPDGQRLHAGVAAVQEELANEANGLNATIAPVRASGTDRDLTSEEREAVEVLGSDWRSSQESNLKLRFDTGQRLNQLCGPPSMSNGRARGIVQAFLATSGQPAMDVPAMRRFAALHPSLAAFHLAHPDVNSWNETKRLLGGLASVKQPIPKPGTLADRFLARLRRLDKSLRQVTAGFEEDDRELIRVQMQKMLKRLLTPKGDERQQASVNLAPAEPDSRPQVEHVMTGFGQIPGPEPSIRSHDPVAE